MRLFVALLLDAEMHAALAQVQADLRGLDSGDQVRWVEVPGIHLTLKFLGETHRARAAAVKARVGGAVDGRGAPRLALGGLGAFPNRRQPRVLWVGLTEESEMLLPLQRAVEAAVADLGWERERRAFQPHLTLGRVRESRPGRLPSPLLQALARPLPFPAAARPLRRVVLMRSHLSPHGARYEVLHAWELSG